MLGSYLRALREAKGFSQSDLEKETARHGYKVDQGTISNIEKSDTSNPGIKAITGLSKALNVSPMKLIRAYEGKDPDTWPSRSDGAMTLDDHLSQIDASPAELLESVLKMLRKQEGQ